VATDPQPTAAPEVRPAIDLGKLGDVRPRDLLLRFAFGAAVSVCAAIIGKAVSARFGGAFLAFPAILPASLTLIEEKEGRRRAGRNAMGAILGGVALAVFAGVGEATFTHAPPAVALGAALVAWLAVAFALYAVLAFVHPDACDARQD
jgi:hypothetical protein